MQDTWQKLKEWWTTLTTREQQAVAVGGSLVFIFLVYVAIWSPLMTQTDLLRKRIVSQQKALLWMQSADKEIQKMQGQSQDKTQAVTPVVLLSLMQKQINRNGLEQSLTQLKQTGNDSIEVHFQKVEFDKFIDMLTTMMKGQAVSIAQLSVTADSAPGVVNVDMVIKIGS